MLLLPQEGGVLWVHMVHYCSAVQCEPQHFAPACNLHQYSKIIIETGIDNQDDAMGNEQHRLCDVGDTRKFCAVLRFTGQQRCRQRKSKKQWSEARHAACRAFCLIESIRVELS